MFHSKKIKQLIYYKRKIFIIKKKNKLKNKLKVLGTRNMIKIFSKNFFIKSVELSNYNISRKKIVISNIISSKKLFNNLLIKNPLKQPDQLYISVPNDNHINHKITIYNTLNLI